MQAIERRKNRSDIPSEAARLFLEAFAKRLKARTMVLANEDGLTVSGVGSSDELDAMAALAVIEPQKLSTLTRGDEPTYALPMSIDGTRLVLASIGGDAPTTAEASAAVERLFFRAA
ncbi:MAG: hypothetical protein HYV07_26195 [Deltaproteobacteria bacterium]|nr:hypothetical protein [Deltaproteobacteria bacterium]